MFTRSLGATDPSLLIATLLVRVECGSSSGPGAKGRDGVELAQAIVYHGRGARLHGRTVRAGERPQALEVSLQTHAGERRIPLIEASGKQLLVECLEVRARDCGLTRTR